MLGTKAESLARLSPLLTSARILPQIHFSVGQWRADPAGVLNATLGRLGRSPLVVRSSARSEDTFSSSNAGAFESVLGVAPASASLAGAIGAVIASYSGASDDDQVLVQPLLEDVAHCGVMFTYALQANARYRVIEVESSGSTSGVTSGTCTNASTYFVHRDAAMPTKPAYLPPVLAVGSELERLTGLDALDVEFAIDQTGTVYLLQVRPLAAVTKSLRDVDDGAMLASAKAAVAEALATKRASRAETSC